jgi:hypothetical protein
VVKKLERINVLYLTLPTVLRQNLIVSNQFDFPFLSGLRLMILVHGNRATRDRDRLGAEALQAMLVEVVRAQRTRTTAHACRSPNTCSKNGLGQSALGHASGAWRTPETQLGYLRAHGLMLNAGTTKESIQTWKAFLANHVGQLVSLDFLTVPTIQLSAAASSTST